MAVNVRRVEKTDQPIDYLTNINSRNAMRRLERTLWIYTDMCRLPCPLMKNRARPGGQLEHNIVYQVKHNLRLELLMQLHPFYVGGPRYTA